MCTTNCQSHTQLEVAESDGHAKCTHININAHTHTHVGKKESLHYTCQCTSDCQKSVHWQKTHTLHTTHTHTHTYMRQSAVGSALQRRKCSWKKAFSSKSHRPQGKTQSTQGHPAATAINRSGSRSNGACTYLHKGYGPAVAVAPSVDTAQSCCCCWLLLRSCKPQQ